jgi:diguanylate cyclase (GGDEF)-like protein
MTRPVIEAKPLLSAVRTRGLGRRLTRAALESSALALVVAGITINLTLYLWSRSTLEDDAHVQARIAADSMSAALLFGDAKAASETLNSLRASPDIAAATLYDRDGRPFAQFRRGTDPATARQGREDQVQVEELVTQNGGRPGRVVLAMSLRSLRSRAAVFALVTLIAAALALAIAYLRIRRVRRAVNSTEERLDRLAFFDPVTDLYNRHAATEHLGAMVDRCRADGTGFALTLLDLDDFKLVNDTFGHAAGDDVLRILAGRLQQGAGPLDLVFRLGGDEFIVVSPLPADKSALDVMGKRTLRCLQQPLDAARQEVYVRGSAGIARFPDDAATAEQLLRAADTAMYVAKAAGKNTFALFHPSMDDAARSGLQLDAELRRAIAEGQLVLHYQPIVELSTRRVVGVEALVRWQHPERGLLQPAAFIDMAERSGLIADLGGWVLKRAAEQQARWASQGLGDLFIAVNVSGRQFRRGLLVDQVRHALEGSGARADRLQIEITEHTLVEHVAANVRVLSRLRELGLRVAIDDFGTGLSSLAYLKRLPIDKLKIDRSFVKDLPESCEDVAIVSAILSMAAALGLEVVAEGIETESQCGLLRDLGSGHGQGYLFSHPVVAERIEQMLCAASPRDPIAAVP